MQLKVVAKINAEVMVVAMVAKAVATDAVELTQLQIASIKTHCVPIVERRATWRDAA